MAVDFPQPACKPPAAGTNDRLAAARLTQNAALRAALLRHKVGAATVEDLELMAVRASLLSKKGEI